MGCKCANSNYEEYELSSKENGDEFKNNLDNKNEFNNSNDNNNIEDSNQENFNPNFNNSKEDEGYRNEYDNNLENDHNLKYLNYPEKIVEIINNIRQDPASYSYTIENSIQNIIENNNINDPTKNKIIYKKKVKVALTRGEEAFREAAEELLNTAPLPPLEFVPELCIPLPDTEEDVKDSVFLKNQVLKLRKEGIKIDVFFKDLVKIPEVSALLMIVDDNGKNAGKKRMTLLNKDFKYIGVNCKFVGKTFIAYLGFSK